jgi:hypothetical protein
MKETKRTAAMGVLLTLTALIGFAAVATAGKKDASQKSSESTVTTNENGSVSRVFTECTVATNGNMVTERRRETRTTMDTAGNVLESSTSEYAQSYSAGDSGVTPLNATLKASDESGGVKADSFLGLSFGATFAGTNFVSDADEPSLLRAVFKPAKPLAGFDDYYVYVTPKTHKVVKIYACAKKAVEPGARWRRHYLIEALEKRYQTWARLCSYRRPLYAFDIGSGRYVTACLAGATRDYETVVAAWDDALLTTAADEHAELREQARKAAAEKRARRVTDAAAAF